MNAEPSSLLTQLRDIHAAAEPSWWPPAPGWWLLALILLVLAALALRVVGRWLARYRRRRQWLRELEALRQVHDPAREPREFLAGVNRLIRAVAVRAFPGTACARLQGPEWVDFIVSLLPEQAAPESLRALAHGPYERLPEFDADALHEQAVTWVRLYG
ncbi:MAG: DUF4381 domain-containing protein [Xanthomonadales bacterium]|nr:DUF4381 domain-containing protein [Xanthomonadales bacterium]